MIEIFEDDIFHRALYSSPIKETPFDFEVYFEAPKKKKN